MPPFDELLALLQRLIATPSFSREEDATAALLVEFLEAQGLEARRCGNNLWAAAAPLDAGKPTLLLHSHHDTVRPAKGWQRDPFTPSVEAGRLYGLGSNDAGGSLVALLGAFLHFRNRELPFNLLFAAGAEEEVSGSGGVERLLPELPPVHAGIVGEPTGLRLAIAERGLLVVDAEAEGVPGHVAHDNTRNAIYVALEDIRRLRSLKLPRVSPLLGAVRIGVTQIEAGTQHNVVPGACRFVIDVRSNGCYRNEELFAILEAALQSRLRARSFRLQASSTPADHPLVEAGRRIGLETFGSNTLSDQALMPFPTVKIGCGDSRRSHTADEFILLEEIRQGIRTYIALLENLRPEDARKFWNHETLERTQHPG